MDISEVSDLLKGFLQQLSDSLQNNLDFNNHCENIIDLCRSQIFALQGNEEEDNESLMEKIRKIEVGKSICGGKVDNGQVTYQCKTCGLDPSHLFCEGCFEKEKHLGHDFLLKQNSSGTCDCGVKDYIKKEGFCQKHNGSLIDMSQVKVQLNELNESLHYRISLILEIYGQALKILLLQMEIKYDQNEDIEKYEEEIQKFVEELLNLLKQDGQETSDVFIYYIAQVLTTVPLFQLKNDKHTCCLRTFLNDTDKENFRQALEKDQNYLQTHCQCSILELLMKNHGKFEQSILSQIEDLICCLYPESSFKTMVAVSKFTNLEEILKGKIQSFVLLRQATSVSEIMDVVSKNPQIMKNLLDLFQKQVQSIAETKGESTKVLQSLVQALDDFIKGDLSIKNLLQNNAFLFKLLEIASDMYFTDQLMLNQSQSENFLRIQEIQLELIKFINILVANIDFKDKSYNQKLMTHYFTLMVDIDKALEFKDEKTEFHYLAVHRTFSFYIQRYITFNYLASKKERGQETQFDINYLIMDQLNYMSDDQLNNQQFDLNYIQDTLISVIRPVCKVWDNYFFKLSNENKRTERKKELYIKTQQFFTQNPQNYLLDLGLLQSAILISHKPPRIIQEMMSFLGNRQELKEIFRELKDLSHDQKIFQSKGLVHYDNLVHLQMHLKYILSLIGSLICRETSFTYALNYQNQVENQNLTDIQSYQNEIIQKIKKNELTYIVLVPELKEQLIQELGPIFEDKDKNQQEFKDFNKDLNDGRIFQVEPYRYFQMSRKTDISNMIKKEFAFQQINALYGSIENYEYSLPFLQNIRESFSSSGLLLIAEQIIEHSVKKSITVDFDIYNDDQLQQVSIKLLHLLVKDSKGFDQNRKDLLNEKLGLVPNISYSLKTLFDLHQQDIDQSEIVDDILISIYELDPQKYAVIDEKFIIENIKQRKESYVTKRLQDRQEQVENQQKIQQEEEKKNQQANQPKPQQEEQKEQKPQKEYVFPPYRTPEQKLKDEEDAEREEAEKNQKIWNEAISKTEIANFEVNADDELILKQQGDDICCKCNQKLDKEDFHKKPWGEFVQVTKTKVIHYSNIHKTEEINKTFDLSGKSTFEEIDESYLDEKQKFGVVILRCGHKSHLLCLFDYIVSEIEHVPEARKQKQNVIGEDLRTFHCLNKECKQRGQVNNSFLIGDKLYDFDEIVEKKYYKDSINLDWLIEQYAVSFDRIFDNQDQYAEGDIIENRIKKDFTYFYDKLANFYVHRGKILMFEGQNGWKNFVNDKFRKAGLREYQQILSYSINFVRLLLLGDTKHKDDQAYELNEKCKKYKDDTLTKINILLQDLVEFKEGKPYFNQDFITKLIRILFYLQALYWDEPEKGIEIIKQTIQSVYQSYKVQVLIKLAFLRNDGFIEGSKEDFEQKLSISSFEEIFQMGDINSMIAEQSLPFLRQIAAFNMILDHSRNYNNEQLLEKFNEINAKVQTLFQTINSDRNVTEEEEYEALIQYLNLNVEYENIFQREYQMEEYNIFGIEKTILDLQIGQNLNQQLESYVEMVINKAFNLGPDKEVLPEASAKFEIPNQLKIQSTNFIFKFMSSPEDFKKFVEKSASTSCKECVAEKREQAICLLCAKTLCIQPVVCEERKNHHKDTDLEFKRMEKDLAHHNRCYEGGTCLFIGTFSGFLHLYDEDRLYIIKQGGAGKKRFQEMEKLYQEFLYTFEVIKMKKEEHNER